MESLEQKSGAGVRFVDGMFRAGLDARTGVTIHDPDLGKALHILSKSQQAFYQGRFDGLPCGERKEKFIETADMTCVDALYRLTGPHTPAEMTRIQSSQVVFGRELDAVTHSSSRTFLGLLKALSEITREEPAVVFIASRDSARPRYIAHGFLVMGRDEKKGVSVLRNKNEEFRGNFEYAVFYRFFCHTKHLAYLPDGNFQQ